jgi:hypothetical protein
MRINFLRFALKYLGWDVSSFLRSRKLFSDELSTRLYKMVGDIDGNRISTYPRFILYNISLPKKDALSKLINESQMIFDSSDYTIINNAFGSDIPNFGQTLTLGKKLKFRGEEYLVTNIEITIADFFNDYSLQQFEYSREESIHPIGRHTRVHEGNDVPHNIIIKVELQMIEESQTP